MPYICYVYGPGGEVPHMEVLPEVTASEARFLARGLLSARPNYTRVELWDGEALIDSFAQRITASA